MPKKPAAKKAARKPSRLDGWSNVLTGLGRIGKDKLASACVQWEEIKEAEAEELYAADDMAEKIIDKPVDECLRNGFKFTGIDQEASDDLLAEMNRIDIINQLAKAWKTARIFGGAGLLLITDDFRELSQPMSKTGKLIASTVLNRYELYTQFDDLQRDVSRPKYGMPMRYTLQPRGANDTHIGEKVDASRVLRFDGLWLPNRLFIRNNYWGGSVFTKVARLIRNYSSSHDAIATVIQDFSVAVFKLKNLSDMIGADDDTKIIARMQLVNLTKSIAQAVVLDAEGEDFDHKARNVSGLEKILGYVEDRLVASTPMPHTVLLGHSPAGGLGQTGNHEQDNWYDYLKSTQVNYLKPRLLEAAKLVARGMDGMDIENLDIEFNSIERSDPSEEADIKYKTAQTDQIYLGEGVVDAIEIGMSRFGGDKYSTETEIDVNLRKKLPDLAEQHENEQADKENQAKMQAEAHAAAVSGKAPPAKPKPAARKDRKGK
jgi:phage-related protein (TIGR01555 family)